MIGKRHNNSSHGAGTWCFPGGHLEFGESFEECALRETAEEVGVNLKQLRFQCVANIKKYQKHHVLIGFIADWKSVEPKLLEPDKFSEWKWFSLDKLPKPLFEASRLMIYSYETDQNYFDS